MKKQSQVAPKIEPQQVKNQPSEAQCLAAGLAPELPVPSTQHDLPRHPTTRKMRQLQMSSLQQHVGNAIVLRQLDQQPDIMRIWPFDEERYTVESIIENRDFDNIDELSDAQLRSASVAQRMRLVSIMLGEGNWIVGSFDEIQLERIWGTFSAAGLERALQNNNYARLFKRSVDYGAEIEDLQPIPTLRQRFESDVKALAGRYLNRNEEMVLNQMGQVGLPDPSTIQQPRGAMAHRPSVRPLTEQQTANIQELQAVAAQVARAQRAKNELLTTDVGYELDPSARPGLISALFGISAEDHARDLHRSGRRGLFTMPFNPHSEPEFGPFGDESPPFPAYQEVKGHFDTVTAMIADFSSRYPTIYGMMQADRIEEFALGSPQEARGMMAEVLGQVLSNIRASRPKLASNDLDYRDLKPIHHQLTSGTAQVPSGTNWSRGLPKWVLEDVVEDHESTEFWISLGLGTLAAAAFIVAEFATLGSATFILATGVGLGAGLVQAGRSWEQYEDLATAADATVSEETRLVSRQQADSAHLAAILDTVFLFLDAAGPVVRGVREARAATRATAVIGEYAEAGTRAAAVEGLEQTVAGGGREAVQQIGHAITELGAEEAIRRSGKSVDELIELVGEESAAGRRLVRYREAMRAGLMGTEELVTRIPNLASEMAGGQLARGEADRIILQAIEQLGPQRVLQLGGGWKKLSSMLGNEAASGGPLLAWRNRLMDDLTAFVNRELRGEVDEGVPLVQRTGTESFTSDLDISLLGPNAAANRQAALSFLAGRTGSPIDGLSRLLYTDLFTDPRRMHLYDLFEPALRERIARDAAVFERELIWNRRLFDALEAGDEALARSIREQMGELGVREVRYAPLSPDELRRFSQEIDNLHQQLEQAVQAGDTAVQERLARQIAQKQAMVNAAEQGGYFSGGGVRRSVSEREGFPGFTAAEAATEARRMLPTQQFTHVLDQLPKLDSAVRALRRASRPDEIAAALKSIGKYGQRLTEVVGSTLGNAVPRKALFDSFGNQFERLIRSARAGAADPLIEQVGRNADQLIRETETALRQFEQASSGILRVLQNRAAITPAMTGNLGNIQRMVRAHTGFLRIKDNVVLQLSAAGRMIRTGTLPPESEEETPASDRE